MTERRLLAVLGFLLALIGGVLVIVGALAFGRNESLTIEGIGRRIVDLVLGVAAILGGVLMYKGRMSTGGLLTIVIGVLIILVGPGFGAGAVLVIVAGVLGVVGAETRR